MKILFTLFSLDVGGIERVTATLANKFVAENHDVFVYCFSDGCKKMQDAFDKRIPISFGNERRNIKLNAEFIRQIVKKDNINLIINQQGLSVLFTRAIYLGCTGLNVKIISVYHNDPSHNSWIQSCNLQLWTTKNPLKRNILKLKRFFWKIYSTQSMRYCYTHSNYYMLLSKHFISEFCRITKIKNTSQILIQNNPVTLDRRNINVLKEREKIVLYVGRLEEGQKRVSRIFHFWKLLQPQLPEWKLVMVGDGPDRVMYEKFVKDNGLRNVLFEGFQEPDLYYQKAPLLVMTSDYEGWPLILGECKAYGCVPVVLGSYLSVSELIDNEKDGIILPTPFDEKVWSEKILSLAKSSERLREMSLLAEKNSHNFDIDLIYKQWEEKFYKIFKS